MTADIAAEADQLLVALTLGVDILPGSDADEARYALLLARDTARRGDLPGAERELHDAHLAAAMDRAVPLDLVLEIEALWRKARGACAAPAVARALDAAPCRATSGTNSKARTHR